MLANLRAISGEDQAFNQEVNKEIDLMDRAGMFHPGNLSQGRALD